MSKQRLQQKQYQNLSPQQIQFLGLLQIPNVALEKRIEDELEDNPALEEDVWQRMRNFDAIYFPDEEKRELLLNDRTLVNTFRIVFNAYFGSEYEILENKMYWGWNDRSYYFEDVTNHLLESDK